MSDVVEQVIQRHPEVKNEGIPEGSGADHRTIQTSGDPRRPIHHEFISERNLVIRHAAGMAWQPLYHA